MNCLGSSLNSGVFRVMVGYTPFIDTGKVNTQAGSQIRDMFVSVCVFVEAH